MSHTFEVQVRWKEGLRGEITAQGTRDTVPFSVPEDFGGPGGEWTPEHFFAAGVGTCVMATFLSIAQASKLPIAAYDSRASCALEKGEGGFRITSVNLSVSIKVEAEKDRERAQRMIEKAEKMCPISNSLKAAVAMQAAVEVAAKDG